MKTIAIVVGTMPEAVKLAPIIRMLRDDDRFTPIVVSTGQHREMLDKTLQQFEITPDIDLDVMAEQQTLSQVTSRILAGLSTQVETLNADAFMVHGDTGTTLAGALTAFQHRVPIVHVEAGLRSGQLYSPFPEEGNRRLIAQIASLHLAPTQGNRANLIREGVSEDTIVVTGNTVVDAVWWGTRNAEDFGDPALEDLADDDRTIVLASAHRRESWGEPMRQIAEALLEIATDERVRIIVPLHLNPAVRDTVLPILADRPNITIVDPLAYLPFCRVMSRSDVILSDSSGSEEEGPSLGKPTLILRDLTERHEGVTHGAARLVGRSRESIVAAVRDSIAALAAAPDGRAHNPYGDGLATRRVVAAIADFFADGPPRPVFDPIHHVEEAA